MYHESLKKAALAVYDYLGSMRKTASILKVSIASICRWAKCPIAPATRRQRHGKLSDAILASIRVFMNKETRLSSMQVVNYVQKTFDVEISRQLAHLVIRRLGYRYKRTRKRGRSKLTSVATPPFLAEFTTAYEDMNIASIDESGFDQRPAPVYGYAMGSKPAIVQWKPSSNRTRLNLVMSMHANGTSHQLLNDKPINGATFADFIRCLPYSNGTALLMDNASIHKTSSVKDAMEEKGYIPVYVPPYSPEYNPIEMVFGVIKNHFYRLRYDAEEFDDLRRVVDISTHRVTPETIQHCFRHVADLVRSVIAAEGGLSPENSV